ncbi:MAG: tryptophan-rich sensory protein [Beijerinckiaceae bacterium]|nr:tryptophan-rich sensory protein [Beijerinckiaceae bacterium]
MDGLTSLLVFIGVCFAAACSGAFFKPDEWYRGLAKPSWQPPDWLFAPAWTVLYIMIAVSGWLVWRQEGAFAAVPLAVYGLNLAINAGWSAIFFGLRRPDLALVELCALWLCTALLITLFWPIRKDAALLLAPYLAWVTFAGALNLAIVRRNPRTA